MKAIQSDRKQFPALWRGLILYCLCAWLAYSIFETLQRIVAYYVPIPYWDYWRIAEHLKAYQTLRLGVFWRQHNEHRIVFPEIVFAFDMLWLRGRMVVPTAISVLCYAATCAVSCLAVASDREIPPFDRTCAILMAATLAFWRGSALALAQPFLLQWPLTQLGVALALYCLKRTTETRRSLHLTLTIVAAVVATYSSANALLVWPLLLALALALRLPARFLAILSAAAVLFVGLYFIGYQFSGQINLRDLLFHPAYLLGFTATYLGMPFGKLFSPTFGVTLGCLNLGVVILVAIQAKRARLLGTTPSIVLLGSYIFTLLTVVVTAAGRMNPSDPNYTSATAPRYLTVPLLNWAVVVLLSYWIAGRLRARLFTARALTFVWALLLILGTYKLHGWREANEVPFADAQVTALSLDTGLTDSALLVRIFPAPDSLETLMPPLKAQHLSLFSSRHNDWLGLNRIRFGSVLDRKVAGLITYVAPVEHGLAVVGWVTAPDVRDPAPRILLTNERGQVVGWGRRPSAAFPPDWLSQETPEREAWVAFANLAIPSRTISAYVVTRHGLLAIAGSKAVPALQGANRYEVGAPLPNVARHTDSTWGPNGIPGLPKWGWMPSVAYSSWQTNDDRTGDMAFEFPTPANGCVAVGLLHGPSSDGLSAQFLDADTGGVLATVPLRDHDYLWSLWKINLGPAVKRVRLAAVDHGNGWGQWLAISDPLACK